MSSSSLSLSLSSVSELRPATNLKKVWLRNVATNGFLSVRGEDDKWTFDGKLWTRDDTGKPAGPYSWERFEGVVLNRKIDLDPHDLEKQVELLRSENETLRHEIERLRPYKDLVSSLKLLLQDP